MKKRIILIVVALFVGLQSFGQAKYVFYFIGDGMGVNQVNATELYLGAMQDKVGVTPLCFTQFPYGGCVKTYSKSGNVTDSAAGGTALATGSKTNNGSIGVDNNDQTLSNLAELAVSRGKKVAIMSTVGANNATPAAFFGHQHSRNMYDELLGDMIKNGFDFYAGSELQRGKTKLYDNPLKSFEEAGYTVVGSTQEFAQKSASAGKILMVPGEGSRIDYRNNAEYYAKQSNYIKLKDLVECGISFLTKDRNNKGFFLMAEGGRIDGACHGNDGATALVEIIDFDEAVKVAFEFYRQHPKETAIIISADHETGGLVVKGQPSALKLLANQKQAEGKLTSMLKDQMKAKGKTPLTWEEIRDFLKKNLGFWDSVKMTSKDEEALLQIYNSTIARNEAGNQSDEYGYNHDASIVSAAVDMLNSKAGLSWGTTGHTSGYVPVYAIGVGQEKFTGLMENTDVANAIKSILSAGKRK